MRFRNSITFPGQLVARNRHLISKDISAWREKNIPDMLI